MKSFQEYLFESSQKTYEFKAKFAVRLTDEDINLIEQALKAVDVANVGKPKFLPMQTHREFPAAGPIEATLLDITVSFPVNEEMVKSLIADRAFLNKADFIVYTKGQFELQPETDGLFEKTGEAILNKEQLEDESGQHQVGEKRVSEFMKDLHTRKYDIAGDDTTKVKTTNELPQNNTSVMGTHKPTMPKVGK